MPVTVCARDTHKLLDDFKSTVVEFMFRKGA